MNWKLILSLSGFGLLMGVLALFGLTQGIEPLLWIAIALAASYLIARRLTSKFFVTGLTAGILMGILNGLTSGLMYSTYIANNPEVAQRM